MLTSRRLQVSFYFYMPFSGSLMISFLAPLLYVIYTFENILDTSTLVGFLLNRAKAMAAPLPTDIPSFF
jgi:hypothetical protein